MKMHGWLQTIGLIPRRSPEQTEWYRDPQPPPAADPDATGCALEPRSGCDLETRNGAADPQHLLTTSENHPGYVATSSGRLFDVVHPTPQQVNIREIAHALSQANRFGGHTRWPYSVAQHLVYCAGECERRYVGRPDLAFACLLHDGAEAYVCDVIRPVKRLISSVYRPIEERVQAAVWRAFGAEIDAETERVIKEVDNAVVMAESAQLMTGSETWNWAGVAMAPLKIGQWTPKAAYYAFLSKFYDLKPECATL